jgi:hypothetical protein
MRIEFYRSEECTTKNSECVIYIEYKQKWYQKYFKEGKQWKQLSRNGIVRDCTAEQLLSHILPPLAGIAKANVRVVVADAF